MRGAIITFLPWLLSAVTIWMTLLAGNKHRYAWLIGLGNQALWIVWIVAAKAWGLIPMNLALWIVYGRNHLKWTRAPTPKPVDAPIVSLTVCSDLSLAGQVLTLFARHGAPLPPVRLRDELVAAFMWARHGLRLEGRDVGGD